MVLNPLRKKRSRAEFMAFKEDNEELKKDKYEFLHKYKRLKADTAQYESIITELEMENNKLGGMVNDANSMI